MENLDVLELEGERWLTVAGAAALAGVTVEAIYKSIERGRLEPREILGVKAIAESDVCRLWPASAGASCDDRATHNRGRRAHRLG